MWVIRTDIKRTIKKMMTLKEINLPDRLAARLTTFSVFARNDLTDWLAFSKIVRGELGTLNINSTETDFIIYSLLTGFDIEDLRAL